MPIYAYRCEACGHAKDVLQKVSDPLLSVCPACGAEAFRKQLTAAGFQLKGSGWYVTDFRNKDSGRKAGNDGTKPAEAAEGKAAESPAAPAGESKPAAPAAGDAVKAPSADSA